MLTQRRAVKHPHWIPRYARNDISPCLLRRPLSSQIGSPCLAERSAFPLFVMLSGAKHPHFPPCHAEQSEASMSGFLACACNDKRAMRHERATPMCCICQHNLVMRLLGSLSERVAVSISALLPVSRSCLLLACKSRPNVYICGSNKLCNENYP